MTVGPPQSASSSTEGKAQTNLHLTGFSSAETILFSAINCRCFETLSFVLVRMVYFGHDDGSGMMMVRASPQIPRANDTVCALGILLTPASREFLRTLKVIM
jgi:hypothetical protein